MGSLSAEVLESAAAAGVGTEGRGSAALASTTTLGDRLSLRAKSNFVHRFESSFWCEAYGPPMLYSQWRRDRAAQALGVCVCVWVASSRLIWGGRFVSRLHMPGPFL